MSIYEHRKNEVVAKIELGKISPGITVQIDDTDGSVNFYKICKIGNTRIDLNHASTLVMNIATGRIVWKKNSTIIELIKEEIYISDPSEYLTDKTTGNK